jgi:hypothetical protein
MQMAAALRSGFSLGLDQAIGAGSPTEDQHLAPARVRAYRKPLIKVGSNWVNSATVS